jgi:peptidoglycan/xylan/chitin deacetylase (PgdA/CDA1 family)
MESRATRATVLGVGVTLAASLALALVETRSAHAPRAAPTPARRHVHRVRRAVPRRRPPQFVVISFDGAGGSSLWEYWRSVARRAHAHFTFFVSGVYLLDESNRRFYHPPRHEPGESDIGFAQPNGDLTARGTLAEIAAGYLEGHEIGTHYNGHFCAPYPGNVGEWNADDWRRELQQFGRLLFSDADALPFGPDEIVGGRTPCLQGDLRILYPVLAKDGFRYDASQIALLGTWPRRELGIWSVPLLELPFPGHTFRVVSMDYNFMANQTGGDREIERETYAALERAFRTEYYGKRAPLSYANHFETWHSGAYDRALARFLLQKCGLAEVRCVSIRELVDWLDALPRRALRRYRLGRFPKLPVYRR